MSTETQKQKTVLSHNKLQLRGEPYIKGDWMTPTIIFDIYAGHPQILVWSKHPEEANKKIETGPQAGRPITDFPIKASTSWPRLRSMLMKLQSLIGVYEPVSYSLETLTVPRDPATNEPLKGKKVAQARIVYGRHPEGYLFIEVRNQDRAVLPFFFKEDGWHLEKHNGNEKNIAEMSDDVARGYLATLIDTYQHVYVTTFDPDFKPKYQQKKEAADKASDNAGWSESGSWS